MKEIIQMAWELLPHVICITHEFGGVKNVYYTRNKDLSNEMFEMSKELRYNEE